MKKSKKSPLNNQCRINDHVNHENYLYKTSFGVLTDRSEILQSDERPVISIGTSCLENEEPKLENDLMEPDNAVKNKLNLNGDIGKIDIMENRVKTNKREESNAFHVLMPHIKPVKNSAEIKEVKITTAKNCQNLKLRTRLDKNKLKLSGMKRKLSEIEPEQERTKKKSGNCLKILKCETIEDYCTTNLSAVNQKIFVHDLRNYVGEISPEEEEEMKIFTTSKTVVKADMHRSKVTSPKPLLPRVDSNSMKKETRQISDGIDGIRVLQSETSSPLQMETIASENRFQRKKSKWSLRINFHTSDQDVSVTNEEKTPRKRAKDKQGVTKKKVNHEESQKQKGIEKVEKGVNVIIKNVECDKNNFPLVFNKDNHTDQDNEYCDKSLKKIVNDEIIDIIEIKKPFDDKLAPLFIKRLKPDPATVAARRSFLHSRSPENEKKKSKRQSWISTISILPFPLVSHVTQLNIDTGIEKSWYDRYRTKEHFIYITQVDPTDLKCVNNFTDNLPKYSITKNQVVKDNIEICLNEIEQECVDAREIWKKITTISKKLNPALPLKKRNQTGSRRKSEDKMKNETGKKNNVAFDTWIQKYKPSSAKEVTGNEEAVGKLGNWLRGWKLSTSEDNYSSGDEFYCSDSNHSNSSENNQVAVLLGPHGCGKTASVYAIAEELGYTVLELNASSKRPGRKILKELEEATKSHRVKNTDLKTISSKNNMPEKSLILIEDVDLIFDEDEGFISAIYQLTSNTKRPIAMTCRNAYPHLNRMAPQQLQIYFQTVSGPRAIALMQLITLAETGSFMSRLHLEKLIAHGDLRKALLKLQYLSLSGVPCTTEVSSSCGETLWQDGYSLYKPIVSMNKEPSGKEKKYGHSRKTSLSRRDINIISSLADDLDTISMVSSLIEIDDFLLNTSKIKFEPSLSLEENMDSYSSRSVQSTEISEWLRDQVMHKYIGDGDKINTQNLNQLLSKKESNINVNIALSQVSIYTIDTRILSTDYLPIVRTICRAEDIKANKNIKRSNRFFHYLQNLRIPSSSTKHHILLAACKILYECTEKSI